MRLIKFLNRIFFVFLFLVSTTHAADTLTIENAWSPEAPPVAKVMAGYMKIYNPGDSDIKIKSAESKLFKRVEIHLTEMKNGMMRMIKQDYLNIKAKGYVELKPGGLHMMLINNLKPIKAGSNIDLTLSLDNGETIDLELLVKSDNQPQMKCGAEMKCGSKCGSK